MSSFEVSVEIFVFILSDIHKYAFFNLENTSWIVLPNDTWFDC